ncbi:cobalamin-binding protein [Granulosicoccus sp. 3-233]|uniref:cobalamin-binding protein n=1 Tax=Granulosicoccus sp. 3-233 TaxID=3417969 RepID=UPI003D352DAA
MTAFKAHYPERIVCLTEETTELLYLLGEQDRIVGISGFTVRPAQARREEPKVSAFTSARYERILELEPDLVIGFSDLQADIAAELIRRGVNVLVMNQRSIAQILDMILTLSAMVGAAERGQALVARYAARMSAIEAKTNRCLQAHPQRARPRVYFEEWDEPMISAIRWVSELIDVAGGQDCFAELGRMSLGKDRIIADPQRVIDANPQIIIGSWCGKKFRPDKVAGRAGWDRIDAVKQGRLHEIKSANILQPGPAALSDGLEHLHRIMMDFYDAPSSRT